ncbi:MAG: 6-bladed beta-propeller [Gracilimonas sp.]|nr:6-bladed beta-propeller [Gracilimonas sp.]
MMNKNLILILLLLVSCSKANNEKGTEINFSVSFEKIHETANDSSHEESWIVRPRDLTVDSDENVYVSDQERNFIQKFDSDLTFIKKIGREGRGPGEFDRITSVYADSVLLGFSEGSSTMNTFTLDGEFITSYTLDNIRGNPDIFRFNEGFMLSVMPFSGDLSEYYGIHIYDNSFEKIGSPQLQAKEIYPEFNEDLSYQVMTGYGNIQFLNEYSFVIAPRIYSGKLYKFRYNSESQEWSKVGSIEAADIENNYSKLPGRDNAEMLFFPPGQDEPLAFRIHGESLFLSQVQSGHYVHFIKREHWKRETIRGRVIR